MRKSIFFVFIYILIAEYSVDAQNYGGFGYPRYRMNYPSKQSTLDSRTIELNSGSIDGLKGQKNLLVKYDYSNMLVGEDEMSEVDYVEKKVNEFNANKPGKGDKWKQEWFNKRTMEYEPNFELLFNKYAKPLGLSCSKDAKDADFIINVRTTHTNIAFYEGYSFWLNTVKYTPSYIDAEITITNATTNKNVALFLINNCAGDDIIQSYAVMGKYLAKYLKENMK
jgi:hypothetical protein